MGSLCDIATHQALEYSSILSLSLEAPKATSAAATGGCGPQNGATTERKGMSDEKVPRPPSGRRAVSRLIDLVAAASQ